MRDALGQRGEAIFFVLMTEFHSPSGPIFRPQFMGDKWPYVDYIVELVDAGPIKPFFFVQVKATREGLTRKERRLKVKVSREHISGIASYPAPTYVVGIDETNGTGYIVSANGKHLTALSSLSTAFPIDAVNRQKLWNEVKSYWSNQAYPKLDSHFEDADWR